MDKRLKIENIRGVLNRLEDTIIFALIERAQFRHNETIYEPGAFGSVIDANESLVGYLLHETEKTHAKMRRYTNFNLIIRIILNRLYRSPIYYINFYML